MLQSPEKDELGSGEEAFDVGKISTLKPFSQSLVDLSRPWFVARARQGLRETVKGLVASRRLPQGCFKTADSFLASVICQQEFSVKLIGRLEDEREGFGENVSMQSVSVAQLPGFPGIQSYTLARAQLFITTVSAQIFNTH